MIKKIIKLFIFLFFSSFFIGLSIIFLVKNSNYVDKAIAKQELSTYKNCGDTKIHEEKDELIIVELNFEKGIANCLIEKLEGKKKLTIFISPGGLALESFILSNYIKNNNIEVKIVNTCASACTYLLFSANERKICKEAKIILHQAGTLEEKNWISFFINEEEIINQEFVEYEKKIFNKKLNFDYYEEVLEVTPFKEYYELTEIELVNNNFITEIENCSNKTINVGNLIFGEKKV